MTLRLFCLVALCIGSAAAAAAQQVTITLPDGRELTAAGSFSGDELARKVRELDGRFPANPQERPQDPLANSAQRKGTSRISGRIVNSNGAPLRQATVRATASGFSRTTTSDQAGRYEFRDLPSGRYAVLADKVNYLALAYGQQQPSDLYGRVEVRDNQTADGIDISLSRGGVIAGRVLDEFGEPASDLQVTAVRRPLSPGQPRPVPIERSGVTNDIGEYRLVGLKPGQYYVSVAPRPTAAAADGADVREGYARTYYPGTPAFASAAPIAVGMNETIAAVDFALVPARVATISGIALDGQGVPAHAGTVMATDRNGNGGVSGSAPIRPDGTFVLVALPPGEYALRALLPPVPPPLPPNTSLPVPSATLRAAMLAFPPSETVAATAAVSGSDVTGVTLTPLKRVNVSGRVVFDSQGRRPPPQALRFSFTLRDPESVLTLGASPSVNDDFTFQLSIPALEVAVRATTGDWVLKAIRVNGVDMTDTGVDLRGSQSVTVEVELTNNPPEISGTVVSGRGEAVNDYGVLVFPQDRDQRVLDSRRVATVRADANGRYSVRTLPPGQYFAVLINAIQLPTYQDLDLDAIASRATAFALGATEVKTVDLRLPSGR